MNMCLILRGTDRRIRGRTCVNGDLFWRSVAGLWTGSIPWQRPQNILEGGRNTLSLWRCGDWILPISEIHDKLNSMVGWRFIWITRSRSTFSSKNQSRLQPGTDRARAGLLRDFGTQQRDRWLMKKICVICTITCILGPALGCRTPSADWSGTWILKPSRSNFQGPVFTVSVESGGEYRWEEGGRSFVFRCDGKFRPIGQDRMQACTQSSATVLDLIRKKDGVTTNAYRWELSAGGKVYTSTATAFRPNEPAVTTQIVASRISGGTDFPGQWRDTSYLQQHADMVLRLDNRILHIGYPGAGLYLDTPLNGSDIAVHGPRTEDGTTYSTHSNGRREILFVTKHYGKVQSQGRLELSSDGRTITESWFNPDKPADRGTLVYDKK